LTVYSEVTCRGHSDFRFAGNPGASPFPNFAAFAGYST
jgi:hypothetical protein